MTGIQFGNAIFEKRLSPTGQPQLHICYPDGDSRTGTKPALPTADYLAGHIATPGQMAKLALQLQGQTDCGITSQQWRTFITVQDGCQLPTLRKRGLAEAQARLISLSHHPQG